MPFGFTDISGVGPALQLNDDDFRIINNNPNLPTTFQNYVTSGSSNTHYIFNTENIVASGGVHTAWNSDGTALAILDWEGSITSEANLYAKGHLRSDEGYYFNPAVAQVPQAGTEATTIFYDLTNYIIPLQTQFYSNDAGTVGPIFSTFHDSATPESFDFISSWEMRANNASGTETVYSAIKSICFGTTAGAENAVVGIFAQDAQGNLPIALTVSVGGTLGDTAEWSAGNLGIGNIDKMSIGGSSIEKVTLRATQVKLEGGRQVDVQTETAATVTLDESYYILNYKRTDTGTGIVNLPAISNATKGQKYVIKDGDHNAATNNITLTPNADDTVEQVATFVMDKDGQSITLVADEANNNWLVI